MPDYRTFLAFQQLQRFHKLFIFFSAVIAGLSLAALTFDEFHPARTSLLQAAEVFLFCALITAIFSVIIITMSLFHFGGHESTTNGIDLILARILVLLLDWVILGRAFELFFWYSGKTELWRTVTMSVQMRALLLVSVSLAVWTSISMSKEEVTGKEKDRPESDESEEVDKVIGSVTGRRGRGRAKSQ